MSFPKMPPVNYIRQLLMFESCVPRRMRFWLVVMMAIFYQFAGGVYLASLTQMSSEMAFLSEDVMMGSYCSLIGLNMIFPMLFRWKFGLYTRQMFFVSSIAIIACSVGAMYANTPFLYWVICLFAGYFKMMGMFACMSTIQLNITPTRNFAVFFPVIYIIVCGSIQLSGLTTAYVTYYTNWRMMNLVVLGMMLIIDVIVYFFMKHDHRSGPYIPLKGIDWIGQILWIFTCCIGAWVFTYGEHYDWWDSSEIRFGTWLFIVSLVATLTYSKFRKEPYISLHAFRYPEAWRMMFLLLGIAVLQGAAHVLQPTFLSGVLNYDSLNIISLDYPELAGVIMGAILNYFTLIRWKWSIKQYLFFTFFMLFYYLMSMYWICDDQIDKEMMYLAMFALGVSEIMMESIATYYLSQNIPFQHFFQNITIIGFVRCGVGTAAGSAIVHRLFNWSAASKFMIVSESFDKAETFMSSGSLIDMQVLLLSIKECYGYLCMLGIVFLLLILMSKYRSAMVHFLPSMMSVRSWMSGRRHKDPMTR
jgi:hypothetical protein